ncbi:MAG: HEAT repeat domain-containing protein [Bryobacterales bacterium]|jgi:aminopeptidase N|nr:HEAT repeat domain-containing protein [Bryobacterales bacterium]
MALSAMSASAQRVDIGARPIQQERSHDYDVQHYRIHLVLDDQRRAFEGDATIRLRALRDGFDRILLDAETFTVDRVEDASGVPLTFEHSKGILRIVLAVPRAYGDTVEVRVRYHAVAVQPDPEKFGMSRGYDLGLGFKEATRTNPALINTLSYPEGARHWFPCYDHPNDKATSEVLATVREDFQVISNGRLVGLTADGAARTRTFHWSQEQPHATYLFVLAAGPYVDVRDASPGLPVSYWVYPEARPHAQRSFGKTREILRYFEQEFGVPFPWVKYHQITVPGIGGGAESTSATVIGDVQIHDQRAEQDFPSHWLVAHEAAHQWWGDLVTMRDWSHAWLHEGFATYYENAYLASSDGEDEAALDWLLKRDAYLTEIRTRYQRPIVSGRWETPDQNFDRHSYQKAALVIRLLRSVMGDAEYRRAIQHFLRKHALQSVDTHDLLVAIRESTGQVLDWFFEEWIHKPGHPVLVVEARWLETDKAVEIRLRQTQEGGRQPAVFPMPVGFGITTAKGKRTHRVWMRQREQTFRFPADGKPLLIRFDEGNHLLCEFEFAKASAELLHQLQEDDVTGRMWAARQLARHRQHPGVLRSLQQSARNDAFWGVRREALRATGDFPDEGLTAFWKECADDQKSAVRVAAIQLLASRRDPSLRDWFLQRFREDDSYLAQAEAVRALGQCGSQEDLPFLRAAAVEPSPRDVIRKAAREAISQLSAK